MSEEHEILVRIRGLCKRYQLGQHTVHALKDVDLDIFRGEYLSIMGPSGSGKSTIFNMVGALDRPSAGEISVAGIDLTGLARRQLAYFRGSHIGYVFQAFNLIDAYDALDNVALPLIFAGLEDADARQRAVEVLTQVGLADRLRHRPDELSGGQQQRVAVARALANSPAIILADEPTGNLDLQTGKEIIDLLKELNVESGVTVISATHDLKMIDVSDRVVHIRDGGLERIERREDIDLEIGTMDGEEG